MIEPDNMPATVPANHDVDFYSWTLEQARHLRGGNYHEIDRENLADEIESLGQQQFNKLESALRVLLIHFLKWDHQPKLRSRSWTLSIAAQRIEIDESSATTRG